MDRVVATTISRLLGRDPDPTEGFGEEELVRTESLLGGKIPSELREFYRLAGRSGTLMEGFNSFARPHELREADGRVLFLEENQGVCLWGYATEDSGAMVHMLADDAWSPESKMGVFLPMMLYYQCAQGGYEHCGLTGLGDDEITALLSVEWQSVVDYGGLFIAWKRDCLLWWLHDRAGDIVDDCVYFSARTRSAYAQHAERYNLAEL